MAERSEVMEQDAVRDASPAYSVEAGKSSAEDVPPGYKRTEAGVIPEDWELKSVSQMGDVVAGKALAAKGPGRQRPYLRTKNVFDGRIDIEDVLSMPMTDAEFARYRLTDGDVLLNEGQTIDLVGRCAIYASEYPDPCAIQNQLIRFRGGANVSSLFAAHLFRYCQGNGTFSSIAMQTTSVAHLGVSRFARLVLAWPSNKSEQRAIATALSDADALIESLDRLIVKKRAIKQAAMQQLLTGQTRLPGFTGEWETKRLGEIAEIRSGGTPSTTAPLYWGGGIAWCTPTDITALEGRKYLSETARTISESGLSTSSAEIIPRNSVIMTSRATIGECAINTIPMTTNQGFKNLVPMACDTDFLYYLMSTQKERLIQLCAGSTFLEVGAKQLRIFEVDLPMDVDEQKAIATILSDMDTEIEALEHRRDKARRIKQGMMQQLLTGRVRLVAPAGDDSVAIEAEGAE